tara:strand:+ start:194 stop:646 length:453 start_codon:yes stop_codon:yes gene_type:complete
MKIQTVITKKLNDLNALMSALSYLPEGIEVGEFSSSFCVDVVGQFTLKKALEIVAAIRSESGFSSKISDYRLTSYYGKDWENVEALSITYKFAPLSDLDKDNAIGFNFTVKSPKSSLKALGLKCKIQTVKEEARLISAKSRRKIVCPLSA